MNRSKAHNIRNTETQKHPTAPVYLSLLTSTADERTREPKHHHTNNDGHHDIDVGATAATVMWFGGLQVGVFCRFRLPQLILVSSRATNQRSSGP